MLNLAHVPLEGTRVCEELIALFMQESCARQWLFSKIISQETVPCRRWPCYLCAALSSLQAGVEGLGGSLRMPLLQVVETEQLQMNQNRPTLDALLR